MAHINNANSSSALALLQWGMTATVLQTTPVSILPSHQPLQTNAWNAILREQPESRKRNQDTALEVTLRSSQCIFPPKKLYPPLGHYTVDVYTVCPEKAAASSATLFFLLYSKRGKKNPAFKKGFLKFIYRKKFYCSYSRAKQASHSNPNGWLTFFCH